MHRIVRKLKISRLSGEPDAWAYLSNSPDFGWVVARDTLNDLMYEGWVESFSVGRGSRQVLMRDVGVYRNSTGDELYYVIAVYIEPSASHMMIEIRAIEGFQQS